MAEEPTQTSRKKPGRQRAENAVKLCIVAYVMLVAMPISLVYSDSALEQWVAEQLQARNAEFINVIDQQLWPQATGPRTYILLGIAQRISRFQTGSRPFAFSYILLAQSNRVGKLEDPKLLAISVPEDTVEGQLSAMIALPGDVMNGPLRIDLGPYPLRQGEHAFGVRYRVSAIGNKGGTAYEVLGLFRHHDSELKEILRDVVWAYSKYESGRNSCNSEMIITPGTKRVNGFFDYLRKHTRSYYGERNNPQFSNFKGLTEVPIKSCISFTNLEILNVHTWNAAKSIYLDSRSRLLWWDDLFK